METFPKNIVGREIQRIRISREMSQNDFATACQLQGWDISRGTLSKIEAGIRCVSDVEVVLIAKVIGCTPSELLARNFKECLQLAQPSRL